LNAISAVHFLLALFCIITMYTTTRGNSVENRSCLINFHRQILVVSGHPPTIIMKFLRNYGAI